MTDILIALIAATPPTLAVILASRSLHTKVAEVHDLANDRLTRALNEIKKLTRDIERIRQRRK